MPKISKRRSSHDECTFDDRNFTMNETRIVSFEETPMPSSPRLNSQHSSSSGSLPRTSCFRDFSQASQLRRRLTSSLCLSEMEDVEEVAEGQNRLDSPVSIAGSEESSSPWGYFIDVVPSTPENGDSFSCLPLSPLNPGVTSRNSYQPYYKPKRSPIRKTNECLSGFLLSLPPTITPSTDEVEGALRRMQV